MKRRIFKIVLLVIVAWLIVAGLAPRGLVVAEPLASADAIVVLSGSSAYVERTHKAAELYRQGRAPIVLLTDDHTRGGWSSAQQRNPFFVERAMDELIKAGVPPDRIEIAPGFGGSTHDEAVIIKDFAVNKSFRSVLIVTSSYHSRRALRTFRRTVSDQGIIVGVEPAPPAPSTFWWLRPQGWRNVGGEYVKLIYYWFRYD